MAKKQLPKDYHEVYISDIGEIIILQFDPIGFIVLSKEVSKTIKDKLNKNRKKHLRFLVKD